MTKLERAKAYLGTNWVGHPHYVPRARHSSREFLYVPARKPYLCAVAEAGQKARAANPFITR